MKLLIVEDEKLLAESIQTLLLENGFQADVVFDGVMRVQYAGFGIYDLIIMDVMMPHLNGFDAVRSIRANGIGTPILMLTARSSLDDRIFGLNSGADYYLPKPFDMRELMAGNAILDLGTAVLRCKQSHVRLSAKEFEIAQFLFRSGQQNLTKEMILEKVWGFDCDAEQNCVEAYISFLQKS